MKQTEAARPRRNQFTETMRQSNPRQKMRHPLGVLFRDLDVMPWFDKRQERAYSGRQSQPKLTEILVISIEKTVAAIFLDKIGLVPVMTQSFVGWLES